MILEKKHLLMWIIPSMVGLALLFYFGLRAQINFVQKFWVCRNSWASKTSNLTLILSLMLFGFVLLDPRGAEEKIESNIADQKTIILIDSSSSMLAEDIRPNRFDRALLLARHFIQRAAGHQISVVMFADIQKKIIPFTNDIDFLDSKLSGMSIKNVSEGGSNLSKAITEATRYFLEEDSKNIGGNILIFSDFEEHDDFRVNVPEKIAVAAVGLGTSQGATIPIRGMDGVFRGNKQYQGKDVVTKLGESTLNLLQSEIKNFRKWIALSYSMPSEEIIDYFRSAYINSMKKGFVSSRPTLAKPYLALAMVTLCIALILRMAPAYIFVFLIVHNIQASELSEYHKMSKRSRFQLAEKLIDQGEAEKASTIYKENNAERSQRVEDKVNYLSTQLKSENNGWVYDELREIYNSSQVSDEIKKIIRKNILSSSKEKEKKEQEQQNKEEKGEEQNQSEEKDQTGKGNQSNQKDKKNGENKGSGENKQNSDKNKSNDESEKNEKKNEEEKRAEKQKQGESLRDQLNKHETSQNQERKKIKLPALLKQLSNDDAELQIKYTDTATKGNDDETESMDW